MRVPPSGLIAIQLEHVQAASADRGEFLGRALYVCDGCIFRRAARESEGAFRAFGPDGPIWLKSWPKADLEVKPSDMVRGVFSSCDPAEAPSSNGELESDVIFPDPDSIEE